MNRILRILRVTHFRTPLNIKVGVAVLGLVIAPAVISVTARLIELGWKVKMYI